MRKVSFVLMMVALSTVIAVGSAFAAGVIGTPHDVATVAPGYGTCSVCHIPHKSAGNRLWASSMGSGLGGTIDATKGIVSSLCSFCHVVDGGAGLTNAGGAELTVYALEAHDMGINDFVSPNAFGGTVVFTELQASDLPYTGAAGAGTKPFDTANPNSIQCTSCHNVHDNAQNRPFLRVNIRDLCVQCHADRWYDGTTPAWEYGNTAIIEAWGSFGASNPGSHPVGTNVTGDVYQRNGAADSPIGTWTASVWDGVSDTLGILPLMQLFDDSNGATDITTSTGGIWNLGLHTANASANLPGTGQNGGVVCVSCHAIHGVQDDTSSTSVQVVPNANLLARIQSPSKNMTGVTTTVSNGDTSPANDLCEMCHWDQDGAGADSVFVQNDGSAYTLVDSLVGNRPNPGASSWSHPIDEAVIVNSANVSIPTNWPWSSYNPSNTIGNAVICESCHVPHPYRNGTTRKARPDVNAGAAAFILRDDLLTICADCHTGNLTTNHHPVGTYGNNMGTGIGSGADDSNIGDGDNILECNDCHSDTGAHNWTGANRAGLDPDWIPVDNARGAAIDTVGGTATGQSQICEGCHYQLASPGGFGVGVNSPTEITGAGITAYNGVVNADYNESGDGTHYLGTVNLDVDIAVRAWTNGAVMETGTVDTVITGFNPTSNVWPTSNTGLNQGGWSRWGSTGTGDAGGDLVCESCHELEPDKNARGSKLLLYFFADGTDHTVAAQEQGANADTSYFCEGCHGNNGPANTHALYGDVVSRTNLSLKTSVTGSFLSPDAPTADPAFPTNGTPGFSTFPGVDQVSCDSCHQVHDANTASGTYILDAPENNATATAFTNRAGASKPRTPTNLDYTGFCDQCHRYTKVN